MRETIDFTIYGVDVSVDISYYAEKATRDTPGSFEFEILHVEASPTELILNEISLENIEGKIIEYLTNR